MTVKGIGTICQNFYDGILGRKMEINAPCPEVLSNRENSPGVLVRVTVTKPVSFRVGRLRKFLKTKNVTE